MTGIEVPQISVQRYVDLLKRRRWQVIPVSLLGLLIGGLVAFFIPRYYVADTLIEHQDVSSETNRLGDDPFRTIVDNAVFTIPQAVSETMELLKWPEARATGYDLIENERAVRDRLKVYDSNAGSPTRRNYALIRVTFKDRDGPRSAQFLNTLVDVWVKRRVADLKAPAEVERDEASDRVRRLTTDQETLIADRTALEIQYAIDPVLPREILLPRLDEDKKRQLEQKKARQLLEQAIVVLELDIAEKRAKLEAVPPRVKADSDALLEKAASTPRGQVLTVQLLNFRAALENFRPGSEGHKQAKRGAAECERLLRGMISDEESDPDGLLPNPEYRAQSDALVALDRDLRIQKKTLEKMRQLEEDEAKRLVNSVEGQERHRKVLERLEKNRTELNRAYDQLTSADAALAKLGKKPPVQQPTQAWPPPRPTDPNILLVALLGCVLGLGLAISLILLLDVLQGTFKSLDDVERGLPVPVLGGMSHLETDFERAKAIRKHRRISFAAAAFVFLCVAIVTIFYVDATRLPPVVRDLLALVLGKA